MPRGEEQKPVTASYRDGWDRIFRQKDSGLVDSENEKAPAVKSEPCDMCDGEGKRWFGDPQHGHAMSTRCEFCGGLGFTEATET